ncbi:MAG: branched-chain amino acid transaminase [Alphaproteobacteria bacterium]|nr:branched-chain amino acid transaminase [Alphaproteobacteria bacterium]
MHTDFAQMEGKIWFDGRLSDWRDAKTHILTQGLNYAGSVFEGIRAYDGVPFKLSEHIERFLNSADLMGFQIPYSAEALHLACTQMLKENNLINAYIRPVAWRGAQKMALSNDCKIHCAIACFEWSSYFQNDSISLQISRWKKPGKNYAQPQSKTAANYAIPTLAKTEAEKAGYNDALMLDEKGYLAEATASNVFIVRNGIVETPEPTACLAGITRGELITICKANNIPCKETRISTKDLFEAEEVFVCGTAAEVTPVCKIDSKVYQVGPVTEFLRTKYLDVVRSRNQSEAEEGKALTYAQLLAHNKSDERSFDIATDPLIYEAWSRLKHKIEKDSVETVSRSKTA